MGSEMVKNTSRGAMRSSDTSTCLLTSVLAALMSVATAERRGKKSVSMAEKTMPA